MAKNKALQKFKSSDLRPDLKPKEIAQFLHDFMETLHGQDQKTKMISIRIPQNILSTFQIKAKKAGVSYQRQIVELMRAWLLKG